MKHQPNPKTVVGVISDTHGLLRPEVLPAFKGVHLILHAGDIGNPAVLEGLRALAPVVAVRGNNDTGTWANRIPEVEEPKVGSVSIYMLHDLNELDSTFPAERVDVVVSGHSHRPLVAKRGQILFLNPGSAGPRRFKLPVSLARLTIMRGVPTAELIELKV